MKKSKNIFNYLSLTVLLLLLITIFITFEDYGISTDEPYRNYYGKRVYNFFYTSFKDTRAQIEHISNYYGPVFDLAAVTLSRFSPLGEYETRHLFNAVVGWIGIIGCWRLAYWLSGPVAAFFACLLLAITPEYFNHMFMNPKDVPFAAGYIWSLYYGIRCISELPKVRFRMSIMLGILMGLTLGIKTPAVMLGFYLFLGILAMLAIRLERLGGLRALPAVTWSVLNRLMLPSGLIAYFIMIAAWPWAWVDPLRHPFKALFEFGKFSHWKGQVLLNGTFYPYNDIPAHYLPTYFLVKLPEVFLLLLAGGLVLGVVYVLKNYKKGEYQNTIVYYGTILLAAIGPPIIAIMLKSVVYNGIRQFLFIAPPLACIAGVAGAFLWQNRFRLTSVFRHAIVGVGIAYIGFHVWLMASLHPYQYIYYNALAGGVEGAAGRFIREYWLTSYREAVLFLAEYTKNQEADLSQKRTYTISFCYAAHVGAYYFPDNFKRVKDPRVADFYIGNTRRDCDKRVGGEAIYRISRKGVLLAVVKKLTP
jgi:hypothetical protein